MRVGLVLASLCAIVGCAAPAPALRTSSTTAELVTVAPPRSPAEAAMLINEASARVDAGDRAGALPLLRAIVRSELLTDHGRASLYWLLAEAAQGVDRDVRKDALGGYVVAASVIDDDDPERHRRMQQARAALLALRVQEQALGTSPHAPIVVSSDSDADSVVAALDCGKAGAGRYVERRLPQALRGGDPSPRRLLCTENGDELTLWFSVEDL